MRLWPRDSFEIKTNKSLDEVLASLHKKVEPARWFRLFRPLKPFEGSVWQKGFKIWKVPEFKDYDTLIIRGTFRPGLSGVTIATKMRFSHYATACICFLWVTGIIPAFLVCFGYTRAKWLEMVLYSLMYLSFLAFPSLGFWYEAKKTKPLLMALFEGWEISK